MVRKEKTQNKLEGSVGIKFNKELLVEIVKFSPYIIMVLVNIC